jgi:hypothetical protein
MRWFYLFQLTSTQVRDAVRAAWAAGTVQGVPSGSELRTFSAGSVHAAALVFAAPAGEPPPFDARIPPPGNWGRLVRSGPLMDGENPFATVVEPVEVLLTQLGNATPVVAP